MILGGIPNFRNRALADLIVDPWHGVTLAANALLLHAIPPPSLGELVIDVASYSYGVHMFKSFYHLFERTRAANPVIPPENFLLKT